jgi:hypothetical protein
MKLSLLLAQRPARLAEARLANLAFAYAKLSEISVRIGRARLHGTIRLRQATPEADSIWIPLTALEGNQSVIEEHFADEDLMIFADAIAFITGETQLDVTFRLEELTEKFIAPLRLQLEQAGVTFDDATQPVTEPNRGHPAG